MTKTSIIVFTWVIIFFLSCLIFAQTESSNQNATSISLATPIPVNTATPSPQETTKTASNETKPSQWAADFKEIGGLWAALAIAGFLFIFILLVIYRKEFSNIIKKLSDSDISGVNVGTSGVGLNFEKKSPSEKELQDNKSDKSQHSEGEDENEKIEEIKQIAEENIKEQENDSKKLFNEFFDIGFGTGNLKELEDIYSKLSLEEKDVKNKLDNEVYFLYFSYRKGKSSSLDDLKKLASKEEEVSAMAYNLLGFIYGDNRNLEKAKEYFELSKTFCKDDLEKAQRIVSIARVYFRVGKVSEAYSYLIEEIKNNSEEKILALLYKEIATFYQEEDKHYKQVLALEKVLEYSPEDSSARFDIAYAYNKLDKKHLSLLHYKKYLEFYPNSEAVLNNLGVVYNSLDMPIKSVSNYEKSSELEHTLASSNLAYKYIEEGFSKQAEEILNSAKLKSNPHPNVAKAIAKLSDNKEQENETEEKLIKNAVEQQLFYRNYAELYLVLVEDKSAELSGDWEVENGEKVSITQNENKFEFYPNENSELYKIEGIVNGLTANITKLKKEKKLYSASDEYTYNSVKSGIAYISKDYKKIKIMFPEKKDTELINLSKIEMSQGPITIS